MLGDGELSTVFSQLTKTEITNALMGVPLRRDETRTRQTLFDAVHYHEPSHERLVAAVGQKRRRIEEEQHYAVKRARLDQQDITCESEALFMRDVGDEVRNKCVEGYIDRTGNEAVLQVACVVCGGEFFKHETADLNLTTFVHKHLLKPFLPHADQQLVNGMVVYNPGLTYEEDRITGRMCNSCENHLDVKKTPPYSLANGLWIGDVPDELSMLTLPEQVLVARYYPAVYVVKLYPKRKGAYHMDPSMLNSGLRGNVSTYHMNTQDVVSMAQGNLLPPLPQILSATIAVTFVGPGNVPDRCMPSMLTVSRNHVRNALVFLRENNPLYRDIKISEENLKLLPEYGVPAEIKNVVQQSEDVEALEKEQVST